MTTSNYFTQKQLNNVETNTGTKIGLQFCKTVQKYQDMDKLNMGSSLVITFKMKDVLIRVCDMIIDIIDAKELHDLLEVRQKFCS